MSRPGRTTIFLLGVIVAILLGWVLKVGSSILQPLVIALLLASMLQPLVRFLARVGIPPVITVFLFATLFFFGMARLGLLLQGQLSGILNDPKTADALQTLSEDERKQIEEAGDFGRLIENINLRVRANTSMPEGMKNYISATLRSIEPERFTGDLLGSGLDFTRGLVLVVIYMLFIFAEQAVFRRKILSIAGDRKGDAAEILDTIGRGIQRYLGVKTIVSLATGSLCYAALVILDIPYAPLWGFLTFILNYIPTFGSIIAGLFPTIYAAFGNEPSLGKAVVIVIVYLSVNITLGSILEPRILGRELNLSPLVVVISVVVWAGLWGVVGSFLAVPLTSIITIVLASQDTTRPIAIMLSSGRGLEPEGPARDLPPPASGSAGALEKSA